jgi:hypothetical protein
MDGDELELFRRSVLDALSQRAGTQVDDVAQHLGWHDALDEDRHAAIAVLFDGLGSLNATSTALDDVLASVVDPGRAPGSAVLLPPPDATSAPAHVDDGNLRVRGLASARLTEAGEVLVVARRAEGHIAITVRAAELSVRAVAGMDPTLGLLEVAGTVRVPSVFASLAPRTWSRAVRDGQFAVAHELVGAAGAMLELGRQHALDRIQFGRPIGSFQAVSHRLADTLVAIEAARAGLTAAWDDPHPHSGAVAKALAGRAARTAARHGQQVLAGIGFTSEHPFHHYVRRVLVLDELLGAAHSLTKDLGRRVVEDRRPPVPLSL